VGSSATYAEREQARQRAGLTRKPQQQDERDSQLPDLKELLANDPESILRLQGAAGNAAVARLARRKKAAKQGIYRSILDDIVDTVEDAAGSAYEAVSDTVESAVDTVESGVETVAATARDVVNTVTDVAEGVAKGVADTAGEVWDDVTKTASKVGETVVETVEDVGEAVADTAEDVVETVSGAAGSAWDFLTEKAGEIADGVSETAGQVWDAVSDAAKEVSDAVSDTAKSVWDSVTDTAKGLWDTVTDTASSIADWAVQKAGEVWDGIKDAAGAAWDTVKGVVGGIWEGIQEHMANGLQWLAQTVPVPGSNVQSRSLTDAEKAYAHRIFGDNFDYDSIVITRGSLLGSGVSRTTANTINMSDDEFDGDTMNLTASGTETLIHEMTHCWQYQTSGLGYIPESLWEQFKGWASGGGRNDAYDWEPADAAGIPWEDWNPEQQAHAVEEYNIELHKMELGEKYDAAKLATLQKYVDKMRAGPRAKGSKPAASP
jgi:gas vesicle protein